MSMWSTASGDYGMTSMEADPEAPAEIDADWEHEWDDADSAAYHARVEAGLEPEAGL